MGAGGWCQALSTGEWLYVSSGRFSVRPRISWRLFDGGRVRAEIRARKAVQRQAALGYEQAVLTELGDAERALGDYKAGLDTEARRQAEVDASCRDRKSVGLGKRGCVAGDLGGSLVIT